MRCRVILIVSACVNVALLAAWLAARHAASHETATPRLGTNAPQYRTAVVVRRQFFMWNEIESDDYATYIANLRDIGCPEQTIRDIIIADVNALFAKRRATEIHTPAQEWWRTAPNPELIPAANRKALELESERRSLLTKLLGLDWDVTETTVAQSRPTGVVLDGAILGNLPEVAKRAINSVVANSQERMNELLARAAEEGRQPTAAELASLREQTRTELQKILVPAQLEEFLLRYSQNAADLRTDLATLRYFNATPEEFRALFQVRDQFDAKIAALTDSTDPNDIRERQSLEAQRENAIKLALGTKRYDQYVKLQDSNYRTAFAQAAEAGDPAAARTVYDINQASQAELARVRANSNLTPEQLAVEIKRIELEQLKATTLAYGQEVPPDPNAPPEPPPLPQNRSHTIKAGDTLGAISTRYGVPVNLIMAYNPGLQINTLKPGQSIVIPPPDWRTR